MAFAVPSSANAAGFLPDLPQLQAPDPSKVQGGEANRRRLADADAAFESSDLLKRLRESTNANQRQNRRDLQNKYCYRQAEMGVGDCGGLRFIPGATKSGKQKTPEWLKKVLGVKEDQPPAPLSPSRPAVDAE